jgi:hypothetical protein
VSATARLARAAALHAAGVGANAQMRPLVALRHLGRALDVLEGVAGTDADGLRGRVLVTAALAESERGEVAAGLALLDRAEPLLPPTEHGTLHGQRGVLLRRTGHDDLALEAYDRALRLLEPMTQPEEVARVHLNRSVLHTAAAHPASARADLAACLLLARAHDLRRLAAKAGHNLAVLDHLAGDLPSALRTFGEVARRYSEVAPGMLPVLELDRARALVSAGLLTEADRALADAVRRLAGQRVGQDLAEARLERAVAALVAGLPVPAAAHARRAAAHFARRDNPRWAARAALVAVRADLARGGTAGRDVVERALALRTELAGFGLAEQARAAGVVAVRAALAVDPSAPPPLAVLDSAAARDLLSQCRPRPGDRLDTRLLWRLACAELAAADGDAVTARRAAARGLDDLQAARARLGAPDLRGGASVHGRDLARLGVELAVRDGRTAEVLSWSERARAQALLLPPVLPPHDGEVAACLAELRAVDVAITTRRDAGAPLDHLPARRDDLRRRLREHAWAARGAPTSSARVRVGRLRAELGDAVLLAWLPIGRRLAALVVDARSAVVVDVGRQQPVVAALRRLLADLDAAAGRSLPPRLAEAVAASTARDADLLECRLLRPVLGHLGDRPLVVVPTGMLFSVPWGMLPATRGRAVTVAPSATWWVRARRISLGRSRSGSGVLLVSGPRLVHGIAEVERLAARFPDPTVLTGADATVDRVLAALAGTDLAHLATHGHHVADNALFSALELADGRLHGYEVQTLARVPRVVVLSACDVGRNEVRPGDESLGVATAFLGAGAATVIASVTRVGDAGAPAVMDSFHRGVGEGQGPAQALAAAGAGTGFVCFGAG